MSNKKNKNIAEETLGSFPDLQFSRPQVSSDVIDQAIAKLAGQAEVQEERVQLVNARMGKTQMDIVQGIGISKVMLQAFDISPPVSRAYGERIVNKQNERIAEGRRSRRLGETQLPDFFLLAPTAPPNYKKAKFTDTTNGMEWEMDQYRPKAGTLRPDGKPMYLSEEQAFYIISKMGSAEAIQRYVREFDSRHPVVQFANRVVAYREESMLQRLGMNSATRYNAMV